MHVLQCTTTTTRETTTIQRIDIQNGDVSGFDVFINGDHYEHVETEREALDLSIEQAARAPGDVIVRDFTAKRRHERAA